MSQRFFRCPHCRLPHPEGETVCPLTGRAIQLRRTSHPPVQDEDDAETQVLRPPPPPADLAEASARESAAPSPGAPPPAATPRASERPRAAEEPSRVGEIFGGSYLVKGVLGKGGMATVYEGEHVVLGRPVALKVLAADRLQSTEARKRFLQEAQAAASLSHPNICKIFDFGSLPDGALYCAMERLSGEALSARIEREGALPLLDAIDIALPVLAALAAAHHRGIIHRDIKPENIFLAQVAGVARPIVKILDFGLAKQVAPPEARPGSEPEITQITQTGVVVGTPSYMAPESVLGQRDLDLRVDLWATGVVLYQALTGRLPFRGPNWAETGQAILQQEPPSLSELRPSAPARLSQILKCALSKDRESRYATAADFAADLTRVRAQLPR